MYFCDYNIIYPYKQKNYNHVCSILISIFCTTAQISSDTISDSRLFLWAF